VILLTIGQDFNIKTGAAFFATLLEDNCGDIFLTIGQYNGWKHGMTYVRDVSLTGAAHLTTLTRVMPRVQLQPAADAKTTSTSKSFLTSMSDLITYEPFLAFINL
jgi:hypothetical protein